MTLYSYNGDEPAPLPNRLRFPDGRTKTDRRTFTQKDIDEAGYVAVKPKPAPEENQMVKWSKEKMDWLIIDVIRRKPFESWIYDETISDWKAPVEYPTDGQLYHWDEASFSWKTGKEMRKANVWNFDKYK